MIININKDRVVINQYVDDKEIYSTKIVDTIPDDINDYYYKYINGQLVRGEMIPQKTIEDFKNEKYAELETYINVLKEHGVEYQDKPFKCDDECKNNVTQSVLFIDSLLPLTWFTRNGEQGIITFETKEEFMQFVSVIANKLAEIQNKYYAYKYQIDNATTQEELDNIVFGEIGSDITE